MSANGLEVFDKTIQTTNIWLDEIMGEVGPDRQVAWKVLTVVLHRLRNRLTVDLSAHLGAQLPLLVRGVYYDQYQPAKQPGGCRNLEEFTGEVAEWLSDIRPVDPGQAIWAVFRVLSRHLPETQIDKIRDALPKDIRQSWITAVEAERMEERPPAAAPNDEARPQPGA